ncbi:MAG TPA: hypothetical protein VH720_02645 [Candidatus Limnocylindrales bacterium]
MTADTTPSVPRILDDPLAEALRLVDLAAGRGLVVRLFGGIAFRAQSPGWPRDGRPDPDIDLAVRGRDRAALASLLESEGYRPDSQQNALFGMRQLYFMDPVRRRSMDVLVDRFEMCHAFEFGSRLTAMSPTLPLAELLLTKLQIRNLNRKDVLDCLVMLGDHALGHGDGSADASAADATINLDRIVAMTSGDWGWWRTVTGSLMTIGEFLQAGVADAEIDTGRPRRFDLGEQVAALRAAIDEAPKSTRWKLRARVGDRVKWYAEPEEMGHEGL